ncbi:hypothetical protein E5288_WYG015800 [Bos mutus]|uniref:Alpha-2-macroglobulin RAP C-terminal domain-containing protein n=1 Tax=Bos mutus TaxID=72004 RepID=A0A6B0RH01_9CETA|nr:hypothetical protein [Bos mutus]
MKQQQTQKKSNTVYIYTALGESRGYFSNGINDQKLASFSNYRKALEESHENAIGPVDLSGVQAEALASRHAELKDRLRSIGQGFDRLRAQEGAGVLPGGAQVKVKIEKHNHYQKQLEISHQKLKHVESFGDQEHITRNKERYAMLEEKTKELGYKVKKHVQDLSSRISRARHNEL